MEGRFTLAQVRAVRFEAVKATGALCLATLCSSLLWSGAAMAQSSSEPASNAGDAAATINPAPPSVRRPELELGRQGGAVAELQGVLKLLGFYRGTVNGRYDEATSLAVVRFQVAAKLPQTGRVSTNTWNALFPLDSPAPVVATAPPDPVPSPTAAAPAAPTPVVPASTSTVPTKPAAPKPAAPQPAVPKPNPYPTLKLGEKGDAVARLQRQLLNKGFLEGQADGAFGPLTEEAVKAAQDALGLEVDGVVGPATWQALLK